MEDEKNDRLVVTPLVSIMKEQVEEMKRLGLKVFAIGLGEEEAEKELRVTSCEVDIRDFKQREPQPQLERQSLRENPNNQLRMAGDKNSDVLRSAPT